MITLHIIFWAAAGFLYGWATADNRRDMWEDFVSPFQKPHIAEDPSAMQRFRWRKAMTWASIGAMFGAAWEMVAELL